MEQLIMLEKLGDTQQIVKRIIRIRLKSVKSLYSVQKINELRFV